MSRYTIQGVLAAAVADAGTFTVSYPSGTNKGTFIGAVRHGLSIGGRNLTHYDQFLVTPGTTSITITNRSGSTWAAEGAYVLGLEIAGTRDVVDENGLNPIKRSYALKPVCVNLGAPITADADGICAAQAIAGAADAVLDGALLSGGKMILDVPRNVIVDSSDVGDTTQTVTVYGYDEYGVSMIEAIAANGTTAVAGKKAFKEITRVAVSAAMTGNLTVGTGDVLGLPLFLEDADYITKELEDLAAATTGTTVAGVTSKATATTGDVRGTYDPNSACDGAKCFRLWVMTGDPAYYGTDQYDG